MRLFFTILVFLVTARSFSQEKDLSFYIEKAQTNSPLLKDLANQMHANTIDSLIVKASFKPQVQASVNAYVAPNYNNFGYDTALSNGQSISGLVGFNQKIIGKNRSVSQAETFKIIKEGLVINKKIALKDLNKAIIAQYITAFGTAEQVAYNENMLALLKKELIILKKLTQNSVYRQTDYLIFISTLKQQELQVVQLKQQYQNDLSLLNYLSGEKDISFVKLVQPNIHLKNIAKEEATVFEKQFVTDSLKIINQNKLVDNSYKPALSFIGDAGYMSSFVQQGYKNFGFSVGLGLSIPIYDGNQRTLLHQKNETALATNLAYKNNFKTQYEQQLLMLNQQLDQSVEIQNQLQSQLQISEALIEANKKLLLSGDAQITDFVLAIGNAIGINNAISQNKINNLQLINEINYWTTND